MTYTTAMNLTMQGKIIPGVLSVFTSSPLGGFFYLLVFALTAMIAYMQTRSVLIPSLLGFVYFAVGRSYLPPESQGIIYGILGLSVFAMFYAMFFENK